MKRIWASSLDPCAPWIGQIRMEAGQMALSRDNRFGLGAVLIIEHAASRRVVMVRKSQKEGYEFSGRLALPGGMVRFSGSPVDLVFEIKQSLRERVLAETGLEISVEQIQPFDVMPPPTTSYQARGARRYTVVLAFHTTVSRPFAVQSQDASIGEACWLEPPYPWPDIAPANQIILVSWLSRSLTERDSGDAAFAVRNACAQCCTWAAEIGLPGAGLGLIAPPAGDIPPDAG